MRLSRLHVAAAAALLLVIAPDVYAATFTVDTATDDPAKTACDAAVADDCSLRGAITAANALDEASTVDVPAGTYELTQLGTCTRNIRGGGTQLLSQVPLCLTGRVTVKGAGAATTIIDGNHNHRVLFVSYGAIAEMRGVTLTHGIGEPLPEGGGADGGNIRNLGALVLTDSVVSNGTLPVAFGGAGGPGIYNVGTLTLLRSTVTLNIAQAVGGGGGVYNAGADAVLTVIDSIISDNSIRAVGGGVFNYGGATATVTGSTITGNSALTAQGGGIYNDATLTLINSTISGNESGSSGGGISNGQHGVADLNNVTVARNTSGTEAAGRGGGVTNFSTTFTLRNTIIAENTDLAGTPPLPDCDAPGAQGFNFPLTSQGYNLIGDATGCSIVGDLTGDITGQDAKLGGLVESGGPTPTHAPADDSPAVGAGSPVAPGSGGASCAANDQRGFVRPIGERCDIGAFERGGPFAVVKITPPVGGNTGSVSALVSGNGFVDGATVKLVRTGETDIVGSSSHVDVGGSAIATTFDLVGKALGGWDVVVTNPDTSSETLAGGFTIEVGRAPDTWVSIVGGVLFRHAASSFTIFYGNRGNVDALAVPLFVSTSSAYGLARYFEVAPPPAQADQIQLNWEQVETVVDTDAEGGFTNAPFLLSVVPAGFVGVLRLQLTLPPNPDASTLFVDIGSPYFDPSLDPQVVTDMVQGARDYAPEGLGTTIPSSFVPIMEEYATHQLEALVDEGRAVVNASVGASPLLYSIEQLQIDTAIFGAARAAAEEASAARRHAFDALAAARDAFTWWSPQLGPVAAFAQRQDCPYVKCGGTIVESGCSCFNGPDPILPPIPPPPGCDPSDIHQKLKTASGTVGLILNPPDCRVTPDHCKALPGTVIVNYTDGSSACHFKKCASTNPAGCIGFPIDPAHAIDPNDKTGSLGVAAEHVLGDGIPLSYVIHFENLDTATAPAAIVVVTDPLDVEHLDLDTFSLGPISFGDITLLPVPGQSAYTASVDLSPGQDIVVTVHAELDKQTGIVTWSFNSIDQNTGQSTEDPSAGFLPPNLNPPAGEGLVSFSVRRTAGLAPGTEICNQASIVFDQNDPLATPNWCNSIGTTTTTLPVSTACGDPVTSGDITAADALRVLQEAVGLDVCLACECDVDDSGKVTASDALAVLKVAVGGVDTLTCPPCAP